MSIENLDALDEQILRIISDNARIPFLEVARACGVSGAAIHQRIHKMTQSGLIKGSQFVFDPIQLGYQTCAFVGIFLRDPSDFDRIVEALLQMPEVVECHYTTGDYDLFIKIYAPPVLPAACPGKAGNWPGSTPERQRWDPQY